MKRLPLILLGLLASSTLLNRAGAVQYEPPINIVFIIHMEDMGHDTTNYSTRIACLEWLEQEA